MRIIHHVIQYSRMWLNGHVYTVLGLWRHDEHNLLTVITWLMKVGMPLALYLIGSGASNSTFLGVVSDLIINCFSMQGVRLSSGSDCSCEIPCSMCARMYRQSSLLMGLINMNNLETVLMHETMYPKKLTQRYNKFFGNGGVWTHASIHRCTRAFAHEIPGSRQVACKTAQFHRVGECL